MYRTSDVLVDELANSVVAHRAGTLSAADLERRQREYLRLQENVTDPFREWVRHGQKRTPPAGWSEEQAGQSWLYRGRPSQPRLRARLWRAERNDIVYLGLTFERA